MEKEQKAILEAIDIMIEQKLKNLGYNYYVDGIIKSKNIDNTYNVLINGETYNNVPSKNNFEYSVNDVVQVLIKNGNWNKKFIDDKKQHSDSTIIKNTLLNLVYPVGSIYMSVNNVSPATFLGGTWEIWGSGKVPVGVNTSETEFNSVEKTGGAKTHTLTIAQMPKHSHTLTPSGTIADTSLTGNTWNMLVQSVNVGMSGDGIFSAIKRDSSGAPYVKFTNSNYGDISFSADINDGIKIDASHNHKFTGTKGTTSEAGSGSAHNNLQPYITCYMWKRVS